MGCYYINEGLPYYVAIGVNPEDDCDIQISDDGSSGIIIQSKLVKTAEEESKNTEEDDKGLPNSAKVLIEVTKLRLKKGDRLVYSGNFFASVMATELLDRTFI